MGSLYATPRIFSGGSKRFSLKSCFSVAALAVLMSAATTRLGSQQASFTVSVFPRVTSSAVTVRLYNAHLAGGGITSAQVCNITGAVLEDFTSRNRLREPGVQDVELSLQQYATGLYLVSIATGAEQATFKVLRIP